MNPITSWRMNFGFMKPFEFQNLSREAYKRQNVLITESSKLVTIFLKCIGDYNII